RRRIGIDLELLAVVMRQQRGREDRLSVIAELGRDIADAQPTVPAPIVLEGTSLRWQPGAVLRVELAVFAEHELGIFTAELKRKQVAAGGGPVGRIVFQRSAVDD